MASCFPEHYIRKIPKISLRVNKGGILLLVVIHRIRFKYKGLFSVVIMGHIL